jgi:hypothetical protein
MRLATLKPFVVGIDPGVTTGVCIWSRTKDKVLTWCEKDFFTVQDYLLSCFPDKTNVAIYVEHPFGGHILNKKGASLTGEVQDKYIGNAGGNRREAQLLAESLRRLGFDVELVSPVREEKWDAKKFRLFTGSVKAGSQHERDAVRLAIYYSNKRKEKA